ncbi:MAG: superoxide dismutase family protein [Dermatophilaceae bacterium]
MRRSRRATVAAVAGLSVALTGVAVVGAASSSADIIVARTVLKSPDGESVGIVWFTVSGAQTKVAVDLNSDDALGALDAFHGFHIHANDNPANGEGCVADPAQPASTWFVSADGHLSEEGETHGAHRGDMPSVLVNADGTAELRFTTGRLDVVDLQGRAVVLHANPDNFGNVPVDPAAPDKYTPNSPEATAKTEATGNAGDRLACGSIKVLGRSSDALPQ